MNETSLSSRIGQYWGGIPIITGSTLIICSGIYLGSLLLGYDSFDQVCFLPSYVVSKFQVYRVYTSVLFHQTIIHVVFNMLAFIPIGSGLERISGSLRYLHLLLLFTTTNALLHLSLAFAGAYNPIHPLADLLWECGIGFSGVIFAFIVVETSLSGIQSRSIFGLFSVPAKWYVWVLLVIFQLLMPHVSLIAHLSGIISGYLYTTGICNALLLAPSTYVALEESSFLAPLARRRGFITGGSVGVGSLPTFSLPTLSTPSGGSTWGNLRSLIPTRQPTAADERFPGRGQTIGGSAPLLPTRRADPSFDSGVKQPTNSSLPVFQARHLDGTYTEAAPLQSVGAGFLPTSSARPPQSRNVEEPAIAPTATVDQHSSTDTDNALRELIAMGFRQEEAAYALVCTNGDLALAAAILSSEETPLL